MLSGVILFTYLFPLTRERYERIQRLLEKKRARAVE
jgi:Na+/melibiose symporter-like transporter